MWLVRLRIHFYIIILFFFFFKKEQSCNQVTNWIWLHNTNLCWRPHQPMVPHLQQVTHPVKNRTPDFKEYSQNLALARTTGTTLGVYIILLYFNGSFVWFAAFADLFYFQSEHALDLARVSSGNGWPMTMRNRAVQKIWWTVKLVRTNLIRTFWILSLN